MLVRTLSIFVIFHFEFNPSVTTMVSETVVSPVFGVPTKPFKDGPNSVFNKLVTEYESLDRKIGYEILQKVTRGSFRKFN